MSVLKNHSILSRISCLCLAILSLCCPRALAVEKGYTVFHGSRETPEIAITMDDCYNIEHVTEVLDLCEELGVPVTFFVIGSALKYDDQAVWQRAIDLGCEIGNHTFTHARLPDLIPSKVISQLDKTEKRLNEVLGYEYEMRMMRPPFGDLSNKDGLMSELWVVEAIEKAGYLHAVKWDVSQTDPDKAVKDVENGSILLYHANPKDIRCLKKLIPALQEKGFICVTVSALLSAD